MYKHILVPTDGTTLSLRAVKVASDLARSMKARVTALHVMQEFMPPIVEESVVAYTAIYSEQEFKASVKKQAEKVLARAKAEFDAKKVPCDVAAVPGSQPWETIVKTAKGKRCDLIVMASHGRKGIAGFLIGSETTKVLTHSKTPVLVCR